MKVEIETNSPGGRLLKLIAVWALGYWIGYTYADFKAEQAAAEAWHEKVKQCPTKVTLVNENLVKDCEFGEHCTFVAEWEYQKNVRKLIRELATERAKS